jgi:hypothetical protein
MLTKNGCDIKAVAEEARAREGERALPENNLKFAKSFCIKCE